MKIFFIHLDNIILCPPALSAIANQVDIGHELTVMTYNGDEIPNSIRNRVKLVDLGKRVNPHSKMVKFRLRLEKRHFVRNYFHNNYTKFDLVWTTSEITVREIGEEIKKTKYVMQLMELVNYVPTFGNQKLFQFDIASYAQKAYKVVVPEYNRAHIVKARWRLKNLPTILPNKPYMLNVPDKLSEKAEKILERVRNEKRKILLYQGGFTEDRRFEEFAEAVRLLGDNYCMYIMGKENDYCRKICKEYPEVVYLGMLNPPEHLTVAKYAYIGILTYIPVQAAFYSELNALYCAPNKIYEYALCDLPMIGTNVPGLYNVFEEYRIGECCKDLSANSIANTIKDIEEHYEEFRRNCAKFYNDTDLTKIMKGILE